MSNKVSIIVPLYNQENNVIKCLQSIKNQTYSNFECLIINDGSTDNSGKLVSDYIINDSRFIYVEQPNQGVSAARNKGLIKATGDYVVFIDSDDFVKTRYIEELILPFENENIAFTICNSHVEKQETVDINSLLNNFDNYYDFQLYNMPWGKGYKKKYISSLFNQELSLGEDLLFNLDYLKEICRENEFVYFNNSNEYCYLETSNSLSREISVNKIKQLIFLLNCIDKYDKHMMVNSIKYIQSKSLFKYYRELYKINIDEEIQLINECSSTIKVTSNIDKFMKLYIDLKNPKMRNLYVKIIILLEEIVRGLKR